MVDYPSDGLELDFGMGGVVPDGQGRALADTLTEWVAKISEMTRAAGGVLGIRVSAAGLRVMYHAPRSGWCPGGLRALEHAMGLLPTVMYHCVITVVGSVCRSTRLKRSTSRTGWTSSAGSSAAWSTTSCHMPMGSISTPSPRSGGWSVLHRQPSCPAAALQLRRKGH